MRRRPLQGNAQKPDSFESWTEERAQDRRHEIATIAYTTATIEKEEFKLALISGTLYVYTRNGDSIFRIAFSAV